MDYKRTFEFQYIENILLGIAMLSIKVRHWVKINLRKSKGI